MTRARVRRLVDAQHESGDEHGSRNVGGEDRAPTQRVDEHPTHHRAGRNRGSRGRRVDTDRARPGLRIQVRVLDESERRGDQRGRSGAEDQLRCDERLEARSQRPEHRSAREECEPAEHHPSRAALIAERAHAEQHARQHQRVAIGHPLEGSDAAAQVLPDGREGDVDDRRPQQGKRESRRARDKRRPRPRRRGPGRPWRQTPVVTPPSIEMAVPVMYADASLSRK